MCCREFAGNSACSAQHGTPNLSRNSLSFTAASGSFTNTRVFRLHSPKRSKAIVTNSLSFCGVLIVRCATSGPFLFLFPSPSPFSFSASAPAPTPEDTSKRTGRCNTNDSSLARFSSFSPEVALKSMHCVPTRHFSKTNFMSSSYPKLSNKSASSRTNSSKPPASAFGGKRLSRTHSAALAGVAIKISGGAPANSRSTTLAHPAAGSSPARREGAHLPSKNAASFFT
mmetsp:Transcript_4127/g.15155  ORF Transcript_4127/g.15155 Transcript_4127/m.15155 type:complete len:227 (+) Transcript_4127:1245-1925(+)